MVTVARSSKMWPQKTGELLASMYQFGALDYVNSLAAAPDAVNFSVYGMVILPEIFIVKVIEIVSAQDPTASITVDIPYGSGCNPEALGIAVDLSGTTEVNLVRMYTKGVPPLMPLHKIFAETTLELG